eukprot:GILI01004802.1.p1 GENE.GILI01004802.1~~GILI01004802.1.p1  ORF type:complete len:783 (+),score=173.05 GILI01004802.1:499-2847(+)
MLIASFDCNQKPEFCGVGTSFTSSRHSPYPLVLGDEHYFKDAQLYSVAERHCALNENAWQSGCLPCQDGSFLVPSGGVLVDQLTPQVQWTAGPQCGPCPSGTYADLSALRCVACPPGSFQPFIKSVGLSSCRLCAPGTRNSLWGSNQCGACDLNSNQPSSSHSSASSSSTPLALSGAEAKASSKKSSNPLLDGSLVSDSSAIFLASSDADNFAYNSFLDATSDSRLPENSGDRCPAGTSSPFPWSYRKSTSDSLGSEEFRNIQEANVPAVSASLSSDSNYWQNVMLMSGVYCLVAFIVVVLVAMFFAPAPFFKFMKYCDFPPIVGGDGGSAPGGFLTILYIVVVSSLFAAMITRFIWFNELTEATPLPVVSKPESIRVTFMVKTQLFGYRGPCNVGQTLKCDPSIAVAGDGFINGPSGRQVTCEKRSVSSQPADSTLSLDLSHLKDDDSVCELTWRCPNCAIFSDLSSVSIQLKAPDTYVQAARWSTRVVWPHLPTMQGDSELVGVAAPEYADSVLKGNPSTVVHLTLLPAVYVNQISSEQSNGYRIQYTTTILGSSKNQSLLYTDSTPTNFVFKIDLAKSFFQIQVLPVQTGLDVVAKLFAMLAGTSFVFRLARHFWLLLLNQPCPAWLQRFHPHNFPILSRFTIHCFDVPSYETRPESQSTHSHSASLLKNGHGHVELTEYPDSARNSLHTLPDFGGRMQGTPAPSSPSRRGIPIDFSSLSNPNPDLRRLQQLSTNENVHRKSSADSLSWVDGSPYPSPNMMVAPKPAASTALHAPSDGI